MTVIFNLNMSNGQKRHKLSTIWKENLRIRHKIKGSQICKSLIDKTSDSFCRVKSLENHIPEFNKNFRDCRVTKFCPEQTTSTNESIKDHVFTSLQFSSMNKNTSHCFFNLIIESEVKLVSTDFQGRL